MLETGTHTKVGTRALQMKALEGFWKDIGSSIGNFADNCEARLRLGKSNREYHLAGGITYKGKWWGNEGQLGSGPDGKGRITFPEPKKGGDQNEDHLKECEGRFTTGIRSWLLKNVTCTFYESSPYKLYKGDMTLDFGRKTKLYRTKGKLTWANGDIYTGQWHYNQPWGRGTKVWNVKERKNGTFLKYDGNWVQGVFHGNGGLEWVDGEIDASYGFSDDGSINGKWNNGQPVDLQQEDEPTISSPKEQEELEDEPLSEKFAQYGLSTETDYDIDSMSTSSVSSYTYKYERPREPTGDFINRMMGGLIEQSRFERDGFQEIEVDGSSSFYKGEMKEVTRNLQSVKIPHGKGEQWTEKFGNVFDGSVSGWEHYKGEFYNGKYEGRGRLVYANEDIYEGNFVNGKPNGRGKLMTLIEERENDDNEIINVFNVWEGKFLDGLQQDYGTLKFGRTGAVYRGFFHSDGRPRGIPKKSIDAEGKLQDQTGSPSFINSLKLIPHWLSRKKKRGSETRAESPVVPVRSGFPLGTTGHYNPRLEVQKEKQAELGNVINLLAKLNLEEKETRATTGTSDSSSSSLHWENRSSTGSHRGGEDRMECEESDSMDSFSTLSVSERSTDYGSPLNLLRRHRYRQNQVPGEIQLVEYRRR